MKIFNLILGKDAIRPFITDLPETIYKESNIEVDIIFTICSLVSIAWNLYVMMERGVEMVREGQKGSEGARRS